MFKLKIYAPYLAWIVALISTFGSLFFSEIMKLPPCTLCWYQRIFVYPLVLIIPIAVVRKDKNLPLFVLPMVTIGAVIAFFHNLLYYGLVPESQAPCALGISCTTKYFEWLGFITIPLLSLIAFLLIGFLMIVYLRPLKPSEGIKEIEDDNGN